MKDPIFSHNGELFLDELPEFKKHVLEVLRQPLEDSSVTISRPSGSISYPKHACICNHQQIHRYRSRISGPLLDRIDIQVEVPAVAYKDLMATADSEASEVIRARVSAARKVQENRFDKTRIHSNAKMANRHIKLYCRINRESGLLLESAVDKLGLSARAYNRILKIARTFADLEGSPDISANHVAESIQYRSLDRKRF